jgi:uncharacterized protein (DUF2384 family)
MDTHGLGQVREVALDLYRDDEAAVELFLNQPHIMLEGRTPLSVTLSDVDGADRVMKVLEQAGGQLEQPS